MAFVRTKKIGGIAYAYLVENRWQDGQARQHVAKYLGKIHQPSAQQAGSRAAIDIVSKDFKQATEALLAAELVAHGFEQRENNFVRDNLVITPGSWTVATAKGKPAVLKLNQGYLCSHTVGQLLGFTPGESEEQTGFALARRLLDAGLAVPQETFITLFDKVKPKVQVNE